MPDNYWDQYKSPGTKPGGSKPKPTNAQRVARAQAQQEVAQSPEYVEKQLIRLASRLASLVKEQDYGPTGNGPSYSGEDKHGKFNLPDTTNAFRDAVAGFSRHDLRAALNRAGIVNRDVRDYLEEQRHAANTTSWAETGLDYLSRPGQAVQGALVEGGLNPFSGDFWEGAWKGLAGKKQYNPTEAIIRGGASLTGVPITKKEARDYVEELPGPVKFITDTTAGILLDPTTYLTLGTTSAGKAAIATAAERIAEARTAAGGIADVAEIANTISRAGFKALPAAEQALVTEPKLLSLLNQARGGVRFAGKTIPGTPAFQNALTDAAGRVLPATSAERLIRAPRTGLRQLERKGAGTDLAGQVERLSARTIGAAPEKERLIAAAMNNLAKRVRDPAERTAIIDALEGRVAFADLPEHLQPIVENLRTRLNDALAKDQSVGLLRDVRDLDLPPEWEGVSLDPEALTEPLTPNTYYPRFREDLAPQPKITSPPNPLTGATPRRFGRAEDLRHESTTALAEDIPFDLNPFRAVGKRTMQSEREVARLEYLDGLQQIKLDDGTPLLQAADDVVDVPAGWKQVDVPVSKLDDVGDIVGVGKQKMLVREEVAVEVQKTLKTLTNESDFGRFAKILDKYMGLWKGYATVPFPFGIGFVIRNATGNVWNSVVLAGTQFKAFGAAKQVQKLVAKGLKEGDPLAYLDDTQRRIYQEAIDNNALGSGFFHNDIGDFDPDVVFDVPGWKQRINPLDDRNVGLETGRRFNDWIEQNARLATFMSQRAKGLSAEQAAAITRKYLFDYTDLTDFDRWAKKFSPFWTFTRKNLPLQLEHMVKQPGKYTSLEHFLDAARGQAAEHPEQNIPEWMRQAGATVLPFKVGNDPVAYVPDLPVFQALDTLQPLTDLPDVLSRKPGADREFARDLFNAAGIGGPIGVPKALAEIASGRQIFSGHEFQPGAEVKLPILDLKVPETWQYLLEQSFPTASKIRGAFPAEERDADARLRRLLSIFTGQQFWPIGDATARSELYRRLDALQGFQAGLENDGFLLPEGEYAPPKKKGSSSSGFWDQYKAG